MCDVIERNRREAKMEGKMEEKINIALTMLKEKISIDFIAKMTNLSVETITKLAQRA